MYLQFMKGWKNRMKVMLNVPYEEKNEAKLLGAKFDWDAKVWYCEDMTDIKLFKKWLNKTNIICENLYIFKMNRDCFRCGKSSEVVLLATDRSYALEDNYKPNTNMQILTYLEWMPRKLGDYMEDDVKQWMNEIIESVKATKSSDFEIVFDPTLVRGMSYYTGTIFEIAIPEFGGSCGGGGRYNKMVGKFIGHDVPACGFSIGFERIVLLLMEQGFKIPEEYNKVAYLIEKGVKEDALCDVIAQAQKERKNGTQVLVTRMNKNKKFQKEQLKEQGYEEFKEFYKNPLK